MTITYSDIMYPTQHLPDAVTQVRKELVKSFSHSKRVGGYLLGRTLGVGSFAKVKEGLHLTTGEKVAIKVIDKKRTKTDNYVRKNMRREGRLLQMVRHPNIVSLLEVMETDNSYYLVTGLCKGGDLMEYISTRKRLPEAEVTKFIGQIVSAVDYLHRLGIIHRDLKIENLLLDGNKDIKLIDFGLSNFIKVVTTPDGAKSQEFCVTQCGSPAYAAPELLNHEKYGLQVDLWSIGVNMYAMLTGGLPFTVEPFNIKALYAKMRDRQMNPLPDDLSRECRDLLRKFLNPDPARRLTIGDAFNHPWLMQGNKSVQRVPCPNKIKTSDLEPDVLSHMSENLGFRMGEVIKFVTCNTPSPACATYHLFVDKLRRYNANLRTSGQIPATLTSRSIGEEGQGRITLHLRDMRAKQLDAQRNNSTGNGTPTSHAQSGAVNSVATDATDTTTATTGSSVKRNKNDVAGEKKENLKPRRANDAKLLTRKTPSLSDIYTPDNKSQAISVYPLQQTLNQRLIHEPLSKGNTALGVTLNHHSKDYSNETTNQNTIIKSAKSELSGTVGNRLQTTKVTVPDGQSNWNPGANTLVVKLTPRTITQVRSSHPVQSEKTAMNQAPKPFLESTNVNNLHRNGFPDRSQHTNPFTQHRKILTRQATTGRSFDSSNNVVLLSANERTGLNNANTMGAEFSVKQTHPEPTVKKLIPKQFVPFRSAQDRPKLSKNNLAVPLRQSDKSKTTDNNMTLHGKPVRIASEEESTPPFKRPGSPHRPPVVRRRLIKRHRLGDITCSGGQMIRDVDQSVTTDLFGSDGSGPIGNSHHVSTPLPSIGQSTTPR